MMMMIDMITLVNTRIVAEETRIVLGVFRADSESGISFGELALVFGDTYRLWPILVNLYKIVVTKFNILYILTIQLPINTSKMLIKSVM